MRRLIGLPCAVLIALSPVGASAFDVDWKYVGRFIAEHGCEAAIAMIGGRWTDEALEIAREAGKRYGCSWAVEKVFGRAAGQKSKRSVEPPSGLGIPGMELGGECHYDSDCPRSKWCVVSTADSDCPHLKCVVSSTIPNPDDPSKGNCSIFDEQLFLNTWVKKFCTDDHDCGADHQCKHNDPLIVTGECVPSPAPTPPITGTDPVPGMAR